MATPRKRLPRPERLTEEVSEKVQIEEFLDVVSTEMFETISQKEVAPEPEPEPEPEAKPEPEKTFVEESILPTPDEGPRFVEAPLETVVSETPVATPAPKPTRRAQRNVPRFSRTK